MAFKFYDSSYQYISIIALTILSLCIQKNSNLFYTDKFLILKFRKLFYKSLRIEDILF